VAKKITTDSKINQKNLFMTSTLDMTWRLTVAFLVPFFIGFYLDDRFKTTSPWLTLIGIIVGIGLSVVVVLRSFQKINQKLANQDKKQHNQLVKEIKQMKDKKNV